ncbi:hypothetical protein FRC18_005575 [Serendipita sp. 400]|nr:hypothetical protein FRC18_005575 [Serendipita sp. 400]
MRNSKLSSQISQLIHPRKDTAKSKEMFRYGTYLRGDICTVSHGNLATVVIYCLNSSFDSNRSHFEAQASFFWRLVTGVCDLGFIEAQLNYRPKNPLSKAYGVTRHSPLTQVAMISSVSEEFLTSLDRLRTKDGGDLGKRKLVKKKTERSTS